MELFLLDDINLEKSSHFFDESDVVAVLGTGFDGGTDCTGISFVELVGSCLWVRLEANWVSHDRQSQEEA